MTNCVFCDIIAGQSPATVVQENFYTVAFVPHNPVTPGHVLFVPKMHVANAAEHPEATGWAAADASRWGMMQGRQFNLITSSGPAATQTIFHLHIHYVPRTEGDGLKLPWSSM